MKLEKRRQLEQRIRELIALILERQIKDPRVRFVSVTDVRLSKDLSHARVYLSPFGSPEEIEQTMAGIESAGGFIRTALGRQIATRVLPSLTFLRDTSIAEGDQLLETIERLEAERKPEDEQP